MSADAELLVRTWLDNRFPDVRVVTKTPADLAAAMPVVKVKRVGGIRRFVLDQPRFFIETFAAPTDSAARTLLIQVVDALVMELAHTIVDGTAITTVEVVSGTAQHAYDNTEVDVYGATVLMRLR